MGGNMNNMMKQLKKAQENMQKKQEEIEATTLEAVSYTHLRAHETGRNLVCRLLLEKKKKKKKNK